jgi:hypothetical protein
MKLHRYAEPDGSFDDEPCRAVQEPGDSKKLHAHWVRRQTINLLSTWFRDRLGIEANTRRACIP